MNTLERSLLTLAAAAGTLVAPGSAQTAERRATFSGGGGDSGKCTIEVYVDDSAEVEISGDRARLRTLSGHQAQWRRFVCSGPMPASPGDFRFSGIDGRGRQELVQDPRRGRGVAVVRIQDSKGGAEGYTFDLEWHGGDFGFDRQGRGLGTGDRRFPPSDSVRACQDAVRERAGQQHGLREIDFKELNAQDNRGRDDTIMGSFDARRGNDRNTYSFSCAIDSTNGRVRGVDISQGRGMATADRYAGEYNATLACRRAAEQRIQRDGYRNVQFGSLSPDNRRDDRIEETARAQRGNNGRAYDFEIRCSVNPDNGNIRSVQVNRR